VFAPSHALLISDQLLCFSRCSRMFKNASQYLPANSADLLFPLTGGLPQ